MPGTDIQKWSFTANWQSVTGANGYRLDVSTTSDFSKILTSFNNIFVGGLTKNISGVDSDLTYYYRVRASNASGVSANSEVIEVKALQDYNYVRETIALKAGFHNGNDLRNSVIAYKQDQYSYVDDIGRPLQEVFVEQSPSQMDVVIPHSYDKYGRESVQYLPFVEGENGEFKSNFIAKEKTSYATSVNPQFQFYQDNTTTVATDTNPYSVSIFESSPLNRIIEQGAPGSSWQPGQASIEYKYEFNNDSDHVTIWDISNSGDLIALNSYEAGELYKYITTDEHENQVIEFTDKTGLSVRKRVQANELGTLWADTYYVFDNLGNLRYVLPPMANKKIEEGASINDNFLQKWAFCYQYDGRKRMIAKRVPGSDWIYMIYDKRNRLVLTQDGNLRENDHWLFTKYDALNRPVAYRYLSSRRLC
ncbi:DUF6443 domain-containing protein [Fulvivirga ligni]|uniref:DUF6443 domain-containing protein n=1 Tax=Fulvivirga ligni TaxID=2904246 RepID=UPI001F1F5E80|nr:DUF6443 domain-containing protein [Fulvivirga ligni]UII21604.1 DUF6443 domain-containing protein [Fulvivirga ligni]